MKKLSLLFLIPILVISFFSFTIETYALEDYTLLAPIEGLSKGDGTTDLTTYIKGAFNLAIIIGSMLAFVMITYGGIIYATTDALAGKETGRGYITDAIVGLLLVLSSWVILYTINPNMVSFDLSLIRPETPTIGTVTPGVKMTAAEIAESDRVKAELGAGGVYPYRGPCESGQTTGCVNLNGLPQNAIDGLLDLNQACNGCGYTITGGTEGGHKTHGKGAPIVDLRRDNGSLNDLITRQPDRIIRGTYTTYVKTINGQTFSFMDEGDHWHVRIGQ